MAGVSHHRGTFDRPPRKRLGVPVLTGGRLPDTREASPGRCTSSPETVIATWVPHSVRDTDPATLTAVLCEARTLVAAIRPPTATAARRLLWAVTPFGVWAHRTVGSFSADTVNARNVEAWISGVNKSQPQGWRNAARAALRQVGRTVNPMGWPDPPDEVGRPPACQPYTAAEEAMFREAAALPSAVEDPVTPLWVAAASCGAGMRGPEIGTAETADLHQVEAGRLVVQVRGRDARLVPIRACWTDTAHRAIQLVRKRAEPCDRFIVAQDRNAAARAANRVHVGDTTLSLRRARATWLTAHLTAGTPLPVLRAVAGPLSAATLDDLLAATPAVTPEQAAAAALRG